MRDARHGAAGLSALGSPSARASSRTSDLVRPASASGRRTPCSVAARRAGAVGPARVVGVLAVGDGCEPRARSTTSSEIRVKSSSLQWKQRSGPLAR